MPCKDITDSVKIQLSPDDKLIRYALRKKTCQGEVGRKALLKNWLAGESVEQILSFTSDDALAVKPTNSKTWTFLTLKHFFAVQAVLAVWLGRSAGSVADYCTIDSIEYDQDGTLIQAEISVEGLTEEIESCGGCATCTAK